MGDVLEVRDEHLAQNWAIVIFFVHMDSFGTKLLRILSVQNWSERLLRGAVPS